MGYVYGDNLESIIKELTELNKNIKKLTEVLEKYFSER